MLEKTTERLIRLLRWSEKYTKTDMIYLASGGFWLMAGYGTQLVTGLILSIAFANLLSQETYGTYQFVISMSSIVAIFTLGGMGTAISRAAAHGSDGALRLGVRIQLVWSLGAVTAAAVLAAYYYTHSNSVLAIAFLIVGASQPFITSLSTYSFFFIGKKKFRELFFLSTVQEIISFLVLIVTLFTTDNVLLIVLAYFASNAFSLVLVYVYVIRAYRLPISKDADLVNYGKHLSVMNAVNDIAVNADKILVWYMLGAAPLAIYAFAQLPVTQMQSIFSLMRQLVFPKVAEKSLSELKRILPGKIRKYFFIAVLATVAYIALAPLFFSILFPKYMGSVLYSQVLALIVLAVPRTLVTSAFSAHQMKRELYTFFLSTPLVRILLLITLIPLYGLWGAIASTLLAELYNTLLQSYLFSRVKV